MMRGENKGIAGPVMLAREELHGWNIYPLPDETRFDRRSYRNANRSALRK